jgi:hypothetical protein
MTPRPSLHFSDTDISLGAERLSIRHPPPGPFRWGWWLKMWLGYFWRTFVYHLPRVHIEWR